MHHATLLRRATGILLIAMGGCGGSGGGITPPPPPSGPLTMSILSGNGATGFIGSPIGTPISVSMTQGGTGVSGKTVTWTVKSGPGTVNAASSISDGSGAASTGVIVGSPAGPIIIEAASDATVGSPIDFTVHGTDAPNSATVSVGDNKRFIPQTTTIKSGGTVTFTWAAGARDHTVSADGPNTIPSHDNHENDPFSFDVTFHAPGTYPFHCMVHGSPGAGMFGTIVVVP